MAYQSGLTRRPGFNPAGRSKFNSQRDELAAQQSRNLQNELGNINQDNETRRKNEEKIYKDLEKLSAFSNTIREHLVERKEKQNEEDKQRGIMRAYTEGIPQEEQDAFEREEQEGIALNKETTNLANKLEKKTGNVFIGEKARQLSGWEAYGYAQGLAQVGGESYAAHLAGQQGRLDSITDPAEYSAELSAIRSEYLRKYNNINPALLNKHMFPAMRSAESRVSTAWSAKAASNIKANRIEISRQNLAIGLRGNDINSSVQTFMSEMGSSVGTRAARENLLSVTKHLVESRVLNEAQVEQILDTQVPAADGSGMVSIRTIMPEMSNYKQWLHDANVQQYNNNQAVAKMREQEYIDAFNEAAKQKEGRFTDYEIEQLKQDYRRDTGREPPNVYDNYITAEEHDIEQETKTIEDILDSGRGYLIDSDLEGMSYKTRQKFNNQLRNDNNATIASKEFQRSAKTYAQGYAAEQFKGDIGEAEARAPYFTKYVDKALASYNYNYRMALRTGTAGTPQEAHEQALKAMEANAKAGSYTLPTTVTINTKNVEQVRDADKFLQDNPTAWQNSLIPGTESALKELQLNMQSRGPLRIPDAYKAIARSRKDMTAWDLANSQLKAATGEGLKPNGKNYAEEMSPEVKRLLTFKPTANRTNRAIIESNNKYEWLNLIASVESAAHGDYDAYNTGGSDNGHTAHGSGNSNDGRFGKPLTQLTIGEIIALQNTGKVHATGRYQFIKGSLQETADYAGISYDEVYTPEIQDALALARTRWRREVDPGIGGLRREWVGLNHIPNHILQAHYDAQGKPTYDQPQNLTPGVDYTLAPFAEQARGQVTFDINQPGIDVYFEDKQFPAVLPGRVKEVSSQYNSDGSGYGNYIVIESIDPTTGQPVDVLYGHLESPSKLKPGQTVDSGTIIGRQGGTGSVQSVDGTIASIDFLAPAPAGSKSMQPYSNFDALRRRTAQQLGRT